MTHVFRAAIVLLALVGSASARTFPVPPKSPAFTVTVPDTWKIEEIEHGYSAVSPGKDVFFSVEYADGEKAMAEMMDDNSAWMKENHIKEVKPTKEEGAVNGVPMSHFELDTTDEDGKTLVDFMLMPAGSSVAMLTLWGSVDERNKHEADIVAIMNSIKPVK